MAEIIGDWETDLLDPLVANMRTLATTIAKHDSIEDADRVVAEVRQTLALLETWRNFGIGYDGSNLEEYLAEENAAWWDFWSYLGGHIRGWWD